ncbi:MAG TPA: HD domain-containing phosphohydrolase [Kribbella sp.]|nr:HD domain-containing phosphohydrolase [Kribbella sp.]
MPREDVRLADLLCALSITLDLAMAQAPEKSIRSCLIATGLARHLNLSDPEVRDVYYATLLRHLGCTATTHEEAYLGGPDAGALRPLIERTDSANRHESLALFAQLGHGTGIRRLQYVGRTVRAGAAGEARLLRAVCEVGSMLAERLGLGPGVSMAIYQSLERWDGGGAPKGLTGAKTAVAPRIAEVATQAVIFDKLGGPDTASQMLRRRAGSWLDPGVVAAFEQVGPALLDELGTIDVWQAALDAEPQPQCRIPLNGLDELARTFAHFVDLKSPYLFGHSTGVAALAEEAARLLGVSEDDRATLRRAALFHDLGRVTVSTGVWERPGPLRRGEWEQVRLHPYHTERILTRSAVLEPIGRLAGLHHERQDGSGYPRQTKGSDVPLTARILAAADVYQAMTQERPHRPAFPADSAARAVSAVAAAGQLDADCARAVLKAAGQQVPGRTTWPAGLSEREVEVLRLLARGRSNPEIARELVVSRRTAEHHVQHIYTKIGVSTRAAAALFAMQHGLFTP